MIKVLSIFAMLMVSLSASEHAETTDIIPRTINFLMFAGLIYYLLAGRIKTFFQERQESIVAELDKIETRIRDSKRAKENALKKVEDAKRLAEEIKENAVKEAQLLVAKIDEHCESDLKQLESSKEEIKNVEKNKMTRQVVSETLTEIFDSREAAVENEELMLSLLKRVA